ncbi:MAG: hypothetical protein A3I68_06150 [Candidatus Melainabacteria bacterium RIFCSPLOWO2_02_FULL_35_15]|nr:MAG: hypothetical protein A3F80_08265 [Candidatus Melainabacteria bacterium RIFCSPLOWO2_12_FULL_35_11]OGI14550.1 MAG: hypothetical protein A3I68_06150 [Candidatus Melainabacteria bacterium RIFCSPLOWO2_02_FULL_35_15]
MTTRTPLRRDLADLKQKVYILGEKCIEISDLYNSLLESYSNKLEERLINITNEVKKESKELNDQCFLVLTLQQPLIRDLRFVIGSLQIVLSLEKSTEYYLSTISLLSGVHIIKAEIKDHLKKMASVVTELLKASLTLYLSFNLDSVKETTKLFSEINYLHDLLYKQILKEVACESGEKAQIEAQLLSTIRSLEKISDLIANITEQVYYIIVGKNQ